MTGRMHSEGDAGEPMTAMETPAKTTNGVLP